MIDKFKNTVREPIIPLGILGLIYSAWLIYDGGVYLVSGDGLIPAYSFTKTSLQGLFGFLFSIVIIQLGLGIRFNKLKQKVSQ